ncbi:hypothetical protein FGO68_gene2192 [Halteria grandinella]|uniref:EXS domain-containing protein n=1 Tax=Halteria grandinella TaxID=5974 RepID=A0A8J8P1X6_HALGN|nr:hypothetical protein FGO68_gene2192 [Halteria grandinella]
MYIQIYTKLRWLNAYGQINFISAQRCISKFSKTFFMESDNVIDKKLMQQLESQIFTDKKSIQNVLHDLVQQFAVRFTKGNFKKAHDMLSANVVNTQTKDHLLISFFTGVLFILAAELILEVSVPASNEKSIMWTTMRSSFPTFFFLIMIIFAILLVGFVIKFLKASKVNYQYIFELDPQYKEALTLGCFVLACFLSQIYSIKLVHLLDRYYAFFTFTAIAGILVFFINPFHFLHRGARKQLFISLFQGWIAPIGRVKFRDFFLADLMTSFIGPLRDMGLSLAFFISGRWVHSDPVKRDDFKVLQIYFFAIGIFPLWVRFMQCFRRYYDTRLAVNLKNAFKYFLSIIAGIAGILYTLDNTSKSKLAAFVTLQTIAQLVSYSWDLYMDWGLLRSWKSKSFLLRKKKMFPAWFYYCAITTNLIMRFMWVLNINSKTFPKFMTENLLNGLLLSFIEILRRAQWAVLRIENENCNNFERYRNILQIPEPEDDVPGTKQGGGP